MRLFNTIRIQTPESIELEFTLAGIGNRALALLIDYIILNLSLLSLLILTFFVVYSLAFDNVVLGFDLDSQWVIAGMALVIYGLYVGYFVGFETLWQGQTPGKRLVKIRVIRDNAQPIGLFQATLRSLLRPVDDILFIGFLFILLGEKEKRLGDWLANTLVVQAENPNTVTRLNIPQGSQTLAQQLLAREDISRILPDDFAIVREYLQRRSKMKIAARTKLATQIAEKVKEILGMEERPLKVDVDHFLEAVYLAYQQQSRGK